MLWSKAFWKGLAERAIKTFAQAFVAAGLIDKGSEALGLGSYNWLHILSIAAVAAIFSVITSIGNANFTAGASPAVITPTPDEVPFMAKLVDLPESRATAGDPEQPLAGTQPVSEIQPPVG